MPKILSNEWFMDQWAKLNDSIWTKLYIIVSVIQTIIVIALEIRVFNRNDSIREHVEEFGNSSTCNIQYSTNRMLRIEQENVIFIIFQLYQLWFCFDAVLTQNTIQLIAVTIMNGICAGYSIVQIEEIRIWYMDLNKSCSNVFEKASNPAGYDIPLVITLIIFATVMGFLAFQLYQQFGWIIYRRIGGSIEIQTIYRRQLILVILLKIDLFFLLLFSIESWMTFTLEDQTERLESLYYIPKTIYYYHRVVTFSIIFLEFVVYRSLRRERRYGMLIFIFLWIAVVVDLILILCFSIRTARDSWYFLICFVIFSIMVSTITWIYSIIVTKDFNRGLKEIWYKKNSEFPMDDRHNVILRQLSLD
ncbi:hypothetical protein RhiirA4_445409 [Rhizophagus irregularis]|uniref:Uncharacterized protein n=1 Tax=Rhizophagus irregularis TaxID=588596 RepID=A0A2I1GPP5_9GLOM|nr:hypothetical protein RhiirA4_445409 [Rhizophagus irregularis]